MKKTLSENPIDFNDFALGSSMASSGISQPIMFDENPYLKQPFFQRFALYCTVRACYGPTKIVKIAQDGGLQNRLHLPDFNKHKCRTDLVF
jgi:hypothetical protein